MNHEKVEDHRLAKTVLHAVFILSGIATIIIGQVLPLLIKRFSLNDLEAGYFFPAQFSGSILGNFLTNWFGRNHKYLLATIIGCLLMAAGVLLMNAETIYPCLLGFFVNGVGVGLTLPSVNMLILEMNPLRAASALNVLNFCWGVGAIICKPFVDTFSSGTSILTPTLFLAVPLIIASGLTVIFGKENERPTSPNLDTAKTSSTAIWSTGLAWVLAFFNFIHVGFESGIGGWLTTYSERISFNGYTSVLSPTFIYFVFFVAGRGIAPVLFRFFSENQTILVSLVFILFGMGITLSADTVNILSIGAAMSGFGTSSIFPTSLARFGSVFGPEASRRAMPLFIAGTIGSSIVTWLIGFFSNRFGDLRSGMYILAVGIGLLILLQIAIIFRMRKATQKV